MEAHGILQFESRLRTVRKQREHAEFDGAQQDLGCPKSKSNLEYVVWRSFLHLSLPEPGQCARGSRTATPVSDNIEATPTRGLFCSTMTVRKEQPTNMSRIWHESFQVRSGGMSAELPIAPKKTCRGTGTGERPRCRPDLEDCGVECIRPGLVGILLCNTRTVLMPEF